MTSDPWTFELALRGARPARATLTPRSRPFDNEARTSRHNDNHRVKKEQRQWANNTPTSRASESQKKLQPKRGNGSLFQKMFSDSVYERIIIIFIKNIITTYDGET